MQYEIKLNVISVRLGRGNKGGVLNFYFLLFQDLFYMNGNFPILSMINVFSFLRQMF